MASAALGGSAGAVVALLGPLGGSGGVIAVDGRGNLALPFNCSGMYRGLVRVGSGQFLTAIHDEEFRGCRSTATSPVTRSASASRRSSAARIRCR
jgi:hypothetical protein